MSADDRNNPNTSIVAEGLGNFWESLKSSTFLRTTLFSLALLLVAILLWRYFAERSERKIAALWVDLEQLDSKEKLKAFIDAHPGKLQANVARMHLGRVLLAEGSSGLAIFDTKKREEAFQKVKEARDLFVEVAEALKGQPMLQGEAYYNAAKAEEILLGGHGGDIKRVVELLRQAAGTAPDSDFARQMNQRADDFEKNAATRTDFYARWNANLDRDLRVPTPPSDPSTPPGLPPLMPLEGNPPKLEFPPIPPRTTPGPPPTQPTEGSSKQAEPPAPASKLESAPAPQKKDEAKSPSQKSDTPDKPQNEPTSNKKETLPTPKTEPPPAEKKG